MHLPADWTRSAGRQLRLLDANSQKFAAIPERFPIESHELIALIVDQALRLAKYFLELPTSI